MFSDFVCRAKERDSSWVEWTWNCGLYVPELMIQLPSSLARTQLLAIHGVSISGGREENRGGQCGNAPSSNSNSCSNSKLLRLSASYLEDLFLRRASQSGSGRAVDGPATVYLHGRVSPGGHEIP